MLVYRFFFFFKGEGDAASGWRSKFVRFPLGRQKAQTVDAAGTASGRLTSVDRRSRASRGRVGSQNVRF